MLKLTLAASALAVVGTTAYLLHSHHGAPAVATAAAGRCSTTAPARTTAAVARPDRAARTHGRAQDRGQRPRAGCPPTPTSCSASTWRASSHSALWQQFVAPAFANASGLDDLRGDVRLRSARVAVDRVDRHQGRRMNSRSDRHDRRPRLRQGEGDGVHHEPELATPRAEGVDRDDRRRRRAGHRSERHMQLERRPHVPRRHHRARRRSARRRDQGRHRADRGGQQRSAGVAGVRRAVRRHQQRRPAVARGRAERRSCSRDQQRDRVGHARPRAARSTARSTSPTRSSCRPGCG